MKIVHYPHPALLHPSVPVRAIDQDLRRTIGEMFERMYEAEGLGLAAPQVALPYQLLVMNVTGNPEDKESERVYINPRLVGKKGSMEGEEGCLSFPGLYAKVRRAKQVEIEAYDLDGNAVRLSASDLEARAWQHELDHLSGIVFIERFPPIAKLSRQRDIKQFEQKFRELQRTGKIPEDVEIERLLHAARTEMNRR